MNYLGTWTDLKNKNKVFVCEGDIVHLSDLESLIKEIELEHGDYHMKTKYYESEDGNITFFNKEDGTPILIIEPDSYEIIDGSIVIKVDEGIEEINEMLKQYEEQGE